MRILLLLLSVLATVPAAAQDSYTTRNQPASISEVNAAVANEAAARQAAVEAEAAARQAALNAATATIPQPATSMPPSVADASSRGTMTTRYALENHTHASKARKDRVMVPAPAGFVDVTFSTPFVTGAPLCSVTAETTRGDTNVVNAQIDGPTTMTGMRIRVTRTAITVASLLGLNILSVPTQVSTYAHYICVEP